MAHVLESIGTINNTFSINKELRDAFLKHLKSQLDPSGYTVYLYATEASKNTNKRTALYTGELSGITITPTDVEYARAVSEKDLSGNTSLSEDAYGFYVHDTPGTWFDGANALKVTFDIESASTQTFKFFTICLDEAPDKVIAHGEVPAGRELVAATGQAYQVYIKV